MSKQRDDDHAAELALADRQGWRRLALGPRILRTETAPVALLAALLCCLRCEFAPAKS